MNSVNPRPQRFDAIVIGASAGGVEALLLLLPALPASLRASVLIVQHLPRNRPSLLAEIFGRRCALPVMEAEDKAAAEPGTVCFAPPDYHLLVEAGGRLALSVDEPVHYSRPSIDVLFQSAADVYRERLLGIVLTGANQDGAAGLAAIHRAGGTTLIEDPASAMFAPMPASALKRTPASRVLPLAGIGAFLSLLGEETPA